MQIWKKNEILQVAMNYANMKEKWEFASCKELCQYGRKIRNWKFQWTMQILKKWEFESFNELYQYKRKMKFATCNELCQYKRKMNIQT